MKFGEANWTQERLDIVRRMDAEGHSRLEIAIVLGVTRNAVCGKLARMMDRTKRVPDQRTDLDRLRKQRLRSGKLEAGLVRVGDRWLPKSEVPVRLAPQKKEAKRPAPKAVASPPPEPTSATNVTMLDLPYSGACKFPVGEATGAAQLFCGGASKGVWCPHHRLIVWQPNEERRTKRQPVSNYRKFGEAA